MAGWAVAVAAFVVPFVAEVIVAAFVAWRKGPAARKMAVAEEEIGKVAVAWQAGTDWSAVAAEDRSHQSRHQ